MTFRQRIFLDRMVAIPFSVVLNAVVRFLGQVMHRDHSLDPAATREIVVCKLVGMGSILQATPLLRLLKSHFPKARLTVVTLKCNRNMVARLDDVDNIICLDDSGAVPMLKTTAQCIYNLLTLRVDHYFDLEVYSGFTCILSVFSMARNRMGFYRHSSRFKEGIYTQLVYFNTRMPVRRIYLQLGQVAAGLAMDGGDSLARLRVEPGDRDALRPKLESLGLKDGERYILVNPNASDLLIERRWPDGHMAAALGALSESGYRVVTVGSPGEAEYVRSLCAKVAEPMRSRLIDTAGKLKIEELFALVEGAACILTNDTGIMHMAFSLARPVVCLFGPGDPGHYAVESPQVVTLYAPVPCSPCIYEIDEPPCLGNNVCMQRLAPDLVVRKVLALLAWSEGKGAAASPSTNTESERLPLIWETPSGVPLGLVVRGSIPGAVHDEPVGAEKGVPDE